MAAADPATAAAAYAALFPAAAYRAHLAAGARPDGRALTAARALSVTRGAVGGADGSALVRVGRTTVLACVRLEVTTPPVADPDSGGVFIFTCDAPPLAAADAAPGRPPPRLAGLAAFVRAVLTAAGAIAASDLALAADEDDGGDAAPPRLALAARVDVTILDADGGEPAAALAAAAAALADTRVPCVSVQNGACVRREREDGGGAPRTLLRCVPAAATLALVGDAVVVDPDAAEAGLTDALVTVAVGGDGAIVAVDAPGVTTTAAPEGGHTPTLVAPAVVLAAAGAARARQAEAAAAIPVTG